MINYFTQIEIQYISALFPVASFKDIRFESTRFTRLPDYEITKSETEAFLPTVENPDISKAQTVQTIVYQRYELITLVKGVSDIHNVEIAEKVTITDNNGKKYLVEIQDKISFEQQSETGLYKVTMIFRLLEVDSITINNYLTSDFIKQQFATSQLWKITIGNSEDIKTESKIVTESVDEDTNQTIRTITKVTDTKFFSGYWQIPQNISNANANATGGGQGETDITLKIDNDRYYELSVGDIITTTFLRSSDNTLFTDTSTKVQSISEIDNEIVLRIDSMGGNFSGVFTSKFDATPYTISYYTKIVPYFDIVPVNAALIEQTDNPEQIYSNQQDFTGAFCNFYLNEAEHLTFDRYAPKCQNIVLTAPNGDTYTELSYLSQEVPERNFAIIGTYERLPIIKFEKVNHFPYAKNTR